MNWLILILAVVPALFLLRLAFAARPAISIEQARADVGAGRAVLVDVREPAEWAQGVAEGAMLLSFSELRRGRKRRMPALERLRGKKLLLYCRSGARSGIVATLLRQEGFEAINVGSLARCRRGGWNMTAPNLNA